ncbi:MAG: thiamine phosphate synthase, partial [Planctomycetota bacterium]
MDDQPPRAHETTRILDANANRAREGLRTAEEYARFVLESAALTEALKTLRHDLNSAVFLLQLASPGGDGLDGARDTAGDVGARAAAGASGERRDLVHVARAALKRTQEALRVLEEYAKIDTPTVAPRFGDLRYRLYDIEPRVCARLARRERLKKALLYVLVTGDLASTDVVTAAREAVAGGADLVQLREKGLEDGAFHDRAAAVVEVCREGGALSIVNDRVH